MFRYRLPIIIAVFVCLIWRVTFCSPPTTRETKPPEPLSKNKVVSLSVVYQINVKNLTDRNLERGFAIDAADMVGIAVDVVYRLITTLFYGASILRTIKWFFFIINFVG